MLTHTSHLGTNTLWCGETQIHFYVFFCLSTLSIDLTSLNSNLLEPDPKKIGYLHVRHSKLSSVAIEMASLKRAAVPF